LLSLLLNCVSLTNVEYDTLWTKHKQISYGIFSATIKFHSWLGVKCREVTNAFTINCTSGSEMGSQSEVPSSCGLSNGQQEVALVVAKEVILHLNI